jgi:cytochrome P450
VSGYDPFDAAFQADPYPGYRALREHDPVHRHDRPAFWALSRFADIWAAVRDPGAFSSARGLTFHPDEIGRLGLAPTLVMLDPPRHGRLRALVSRGFTRGRVERVAGEIRDFARSRIDRMARRAADGEPVDLHRDFSSPIPTFVVARLLGVPEADRSRFDPWVFALTSFQDNGFQVTDEPAVRAVAEMFGYFSDVITARRAAPGDDLVSALTVAEIDGERLSDWDILGFCFAMVAGGNDTTSNLISHAVALLDQRHDQRELLLARPDLLPGAILEFLRLESSVQGLARTTLRPVTLHGVTIPEGEKVLMLFGSGNRDEREFGPTADRLDVTRRFQRHLGFSGGVHFCIGSHLARLQAHVALTELLGRFPTIGVDIAAAQRIQSAYTRGWVSLPATGCAE